jgi:hypothetical protein
MRSCVAVLVVAAASLASASSTTTGKPRGLPTPAFVIDSHVHLTNTSIFNYSSWGNPGAGVCPCAPPCLCNWTISDWQAASSTLSPNKFVFVEVNVARSQWLEEAQWVQRMADTVPTGTQIGGIVAAPPLGFGSPNVSVADMAAELDKLAALPLARGVRPPIQWATLTEASFVALVAHTKLLLVRGPTHHPPYVSFSACVVHCGPFPRALRCCCRSGASRSTSLGPWLPQELQRLVGC